MITETQFEWLQKNYKNGVKPKGAKAEVYWNRMQHRIDRELGMLAKVSALYPEIFIDEETEIKEMSGHIISHRRFMKLLVCVNALNPDFNAAVVLEKIKKDEKMQPLTKPPEKVEKKI